MILRCPACLHSAPLDAFIPPKLGEWFTARAFVLLLIVVVLGLLHGLGFLTVKKGE